MFVSPGASNTEENTKLRQYERWFLGASITAIMTYLTIQASYLSDSIADKYRIRGLKPTFWGERYADLNDGQLNSFRSGFVLLTFVAVTFVALRKFLVRNKPDLKSQLYYYLVFGLGFGFYLHGPGVLFLLGMVVANYLLAENLRGQKFFPLVVWVLNLGFLLVTEYYNGYQFGQVSRSLEFLDRVPVEMKWHRVTNMCMLKVVSFAIDYHWKTLNVIKDTKEKHMTKCIECTEEIDCLKLRTEEHSNHYSLLSFAAYFFYPPLYLAGPTTCYNAWISQVQRPQKTFDTKRLGVYIFRFCVCFFLLEWFIHNLYFPTIANNKHNRDIWEEFGAYELVMAAYFILKWIWLKFLVIWRYFRIWALLDGIESPENMGRCMSNNYCFEGFWRMWHRGFNQWLIRYLFVPLGGSKYKIFNIWVVFGFVALWHDLSLNLLAWGWGMCIFIMPEVLVKRYFNQKKFENFRNTYLYFYLSVFAGGFYVILMIIANLVGFSFGIAGLEIAMQNLSSFEGTLMVLKGFFLVIFPSVILMFNLRNEEIRKYGRELGY